MSKKKESKQKKINVRVDFTPMVDMLMLLITFFMLCTTLSKPQTMELTLPSNDENIDKDDRNEAKASQTVTLYLAAKDKIYYGEGVPEYNNPQWLKDATWGGGDTGIRNVLRNHRVETGEVPVKEIELAVKQLNMDKSSGKKPELAVDSIFQKEMAKLKKGEMPDGRKLPTLTIVIKPTDNASYKNMVDALDEMQILSIGTYVIDKLNPDDEKLLKSRNVEM
jgi:biopolymer transport protein ExbD